MNDNHSVNWEVQIENVLRSHAGVREVAVVRDGRDFIRAFVVPDDRYVDDVLGRKSAQSLILAKWRKTYDLTQLTKDASSSPLGFNTCGWNSSYTQQAIAAEEMREWVEATVADILSLAPRTIYEIGCGTGMLLMKIAPRCHRYAAADFAPAVLTRLREQLLKVPTLAERVYVMERIADDFDGLDPSSFDTVVINSVAQHFPSVAYLTKVLEQAVNIVRDGGHVFVGDIRNLPLLPAFASSVELFRAADEMSVEELRDRVRRRIQTQKELVLSPAYFLWLQDRISRISRVEIQLRRDRSDNEMSRYRYHAILHVGHQTIAPFEVEFLDWAEHEWQLDEIRSLLRRRPGECIGIKRIRNARLEKDLVILAKLGAADGPRTAGQVRRETEQTVRRGIHPRDLVDLRTPDLVCQVFLSWAACRTDGSYDALFVPTGSLQGQCSPAINWPRPGVAQFMQFANAPGQIRLHGELLDQLRTHCRHNLRERLVPGDIKVVDTLVSTIRNEELLAALGSQFGGP